MIDQTISHYRIVDKIGGGAMGVIYRAEDLDLKRPAALKFLPPEMSGDQDTKERFLREARAASALDHSNICTIYEIGETKHHRLFIAMACYEGETLKERIERGPMAIDEAIDLARQIAAGLAAAHEQGIVHRDVKPSNIFITSQSQVKILDFGLAKILTDVSRLTRTGSAMGTPSYMSPEQTRGEELDPRSDLWSLGVVLYEMLSGVRPFSGSNLPAVILAIHSHQPEFLQKLRPSVPFELAESVARLLQKRAEDRYGSCRELLDGLAPFAGSSKSSTTTAPLAVHRPRRLWPAVAALAALAVAGSLWLRGVFPPWSPQGDSEVEPRPPLAPVPTADTPSIAVLPLVDRSPDKDQEYFTDGLTEELISSLARIEGLRVAARTSSFSFKGKDLKAGEIAQDLGVSTILEGSIRKAGNHVRITAQLVNAADGFQLWSETYDRELDDIFAVQDDIARSVTEALEVRLLGDLAASSHPEVEVYNAYLQGRHFHFRHNDEDLQRAIAYYEEALALDADYAPAWAGLADVFLRRAIDFAAVPLDEGVDRARQAVERALELDEGLAEAHTILGTIKRSYDRDWAGADASLQRALALEPNNANIIGDAADLASILGRGDEALVLSRQMVELDPLHPGAYTAQGMQAWYSGSLDEAVVAYEKTLELAPNQVLAHTALGRVYLAQSRPEKALREMEQEPHVLFRLYGLGLAQYAVGNLEEASLALQELIDSFGDVAAFQVAEVYAFQGDADRAFQWLERAYAQRDAGLVWTKPSPLLASLRDDPRFAAMLKKMDLPD